VNTASGPTADGQQPAGKVMPRCGPIQECHPTPPALFQSTTPTAPCGMLRCNQDSTLQQAIHPYIANKPINNACFPFNSRNSATIAHATKAATRVFYAGWRSTVIKLTPLPTIAAAAVFRHKLWAANCINMSPASGQPCMMLANGHCNLPPLWQGVVQVEHPTGHGNNAHTAGQHNVPTTPGQPWAPHSGHSFS
jgi:hypothetical protein